MGHPRAAITINIQELQNDGGLLAASVNSACLSLLDSGVAMQFLVAAVSCALSPDGALLLDPSAREVKTAAAHVVFVFESRSKAVISTHSEGAVKQEDFQKCLVAARSAVDSVFEFYRTVISRKFSKEC